MKKHKEPETLGSRLHYLLSKYNLSPERLAALVNMSGVSIRAIIKNESEPYPATIEKLAKALGSTVDYLLRGEGEALPAGKKELIPIEKTGVADPWKDEAWTMAKQQISKKDATIDRLSVSFDRLTEFLNRIDPKVFHQPVKETAPQLRKVA